MLRKYLITITITFCLAGTSSGQQDNFNEQLFFQSLKDIYYTINGTGLKNFTVFVTNDTIEKFAATNWQNQEIFPIQLIWFSPDKIYLSRTGVPALTPANKAAYTELLERLTQRVRGIIVNLLQFYLVGLYDSISDNYKLQHNEQAVQINLTDGEGENLTRTKLLFGLNGLLLRIELIYPNQNKLINIIPVFKTVKTKWLCEGWSSQTFINGEVQDGYELKLENIFAQNVWLPTMVLLKVQTRDVAGATFFDVIKFKNYLFNQSVELIEQPQK